MASKGVTNVPSYNTMINGFCKIKKVDEAMNLFKEMHCKNIIPNVVTYNSLIDGLSKSGIISYVLQLVDQMHDRGVPPNIVTYNSILDALCKTHQVDKTIALSTKFKDQSGRLKDARNIFEDLLVKGYNVTVNTYTVMIQGFCSHGLFDESLALLSKMEENGCISNAVTYEIIIRSLFANDEMITRDLL
ncbi:pentatricopeptide (PPR) repeat protein [Medicago truncatula]|uniref:Pentatricopeptide (PPR) repeat protein n=1 Tax=Medicago truncatula TaxID=3880 RepID=A0A072UAV9_MEDTR|nr:pentatricopeptide (PPR) repeat protein [Medicago truncatula]